MPLNNFCYSYLPYCVQRQPDGRYAVLNREYKPVGFHTREHVIYEDLPVLVKFKGLTPEIAEMASWSGSQNTDCVYLYDDDRVPTHSAANMEQYMLRLESLAVLQIEQSV